jgi:signal transduction histidine kinase
MQANNINLKGLPVLLVDDDMDCREFLTVILEEGGLDVTQAPDAEKAIEVLKNKKIEVIMTDKNLPGMDGIQFTRYVRENYGNIPVILITGQSTVESAVDALKMGAQDYLVKPLQDGDMLLRTIRGVVEKCRLVEENMLLQDRLLQAKKMESVGVLAAGIAHEINNPAGFVIGNLDLLKEDMQVVLDANNQIRNMLISLLDGNYDDADKIRKCLDMVMKESQLERLQAEIPEMINDACDGAERIKKIVSGLRGFARPDTKKIKLFDINEELERSLTLVYNELKYKCVIQKDLQDLPGVSGNAGQIVQVLVNLLINVGQAIEGRDGLIKIKTYQDNNCVCIRITDNGKGIPEENLDHIFDPFFTTKEVGEGTGLGLSIAYGIVKNHNGEMDVESKVGEGTSITISLPAGE